MRAPLAVAAWLLAAPVAQAGDGWYAAGQAEEGHLLFNNYCAECHRPDLTGAAGPALIGERFHKDWGGKTVADLYAYEHQNMPAVNPGSIPPGQLWPITAYILKRNGLAAGAVALGAESAARLVLPAQ